jgi:hypothetical protein
LSRMMATVSHGYPFFNGKGERIWHIPRDHFFIKSDSIGLDSAILGPLPFSDLLGIILMKLPAKQVRDIGYQADNDKLMERIEI